MRTFTAIFYFLFFSLTAWGEAKGVRNSLAEKSQINFGHHGLFRLKASARPGFDIAVASSLQVSPGRIRKGKTL